MKSVLKKASYLDLVIIALVLCFLLSLLSRYAMQKKRSEEAALSHARISFEIHGVPLELAEAISKEGKLLFTSGGELGELVSDSVSILPATVLFTDLDGNLIKTESQTKFDLFGTLYSVGFWGDGGFFANGESYIAPNMTLSVKNSIAEAEIFIVDLRFL